WDQRRTGRRRESIASDFCSIDDLLRPGLSAGPMEPARAQFSIRARRIPDPALSSLLLADDFRHTLAGAAKAVRALAPLHAGAHRCIKRLDASGRSHRF